MTLLNALYGFGLLSSIIKLLLSYFLQPSIITWCINSIPY